MTQGLSWGRDGVPERDWHVWRPSGRQDTENDSMTPSFQSDQLSDWWLHFLS